MAGHCSIRQRMAVQDRAYPLVVAPSCPGRTSVASHRFRVIEDDYHRDAMRHEAAHRSSLLQHIAACSSLYQQMVANRIAAGRSSRPQRIAAGVSTLPQTEARAAHSTSQCAA